MEYLDFAAAVFISALAGMGIGGGGLLVIWLVLLRHLPAPTAQGINLVFFVVCAVCALPIHIKKRTLPTRQILFLSGTALPGAVLGCLLASHIPALAARRCFGYFLLLSGIMQLYRQIKTQFFS